MTTLTKSIFTASLLIPGAAFATVNLGDVLGTTEAAVTASLEAAGYQVLEIETEDGEIEADAELDGALFEFEVADDTGAVVEIEREDEDNADEDDDDDDNT